MRVAIAGGTGFVGSYLVEALLGAGHEVSLLVRPGSESRAPHAPGCATVAGDVNSPETLDRLVAGCDAAIYNVGILREFPAKGITFAGLQRDGARRLIEAARKAGTDRFLLMSANGVKSDGTPYQRTKFEAEQALEASGLEGTIFRPSVIFGDPRGRDEFASQLCREMICPPLPAVAFHNGLLPTHHSVEMSPVSVEDVAGAFAAALENPATYGRVFTLGGPEVLTFRQILERIAAAVGRKKPILPMPIGVMRLAATLLDRIPQFPVTRDQLTMLSEGNAAAPDEIASLLGRAPAAFDREALGYLECGRN